MNLEEVLKKLGAIREGCGLCLLSRMKGYCWPERNDPGDQWLLIGEITLALREIGCAGIDSEWFNDGTVGMKVWFYEGHPNRGDHQYSGREFECFLQAANELLPEVE